MTNACTHISVNSYVTIINLTLISNFISILQTLLGSSDLVKSQLKRSKIVRITRLINLTQSLRARTLTFIYTSRNNKHHIPILYKVNENLHYYRYMYEGPKNLNIS